MARPRPGHTSLLARRIRSFHQLHAPRAQHGTAQQAHSAPTPCGSERPRAAQAWQAVQLPTTHTNVSSLPTAGRGICAALARAASCMLCVTERLESRRQGVESHAQPRASFSEGPGQCCGRRSGRLRPPVALHARRPRRACPRRPCRSPRRCPSRSASPSPERPVWMLSSMSM